MPNFFEKIKSFSEKVNKKERVIPFENGIDFVISVSEKKVELKFKKNKEVVLDLRTFVPDDVEIEQNEEKKWNYEYGKDGERKIYIGKFRKADFFLSFLHEAGHANDQLENELFNDFAKKFYHKLMMKNRSIFKYDPEFSDFYQEEVRQKLRLERRAWAFALWSTRKIEKELGIEIFKKIGTVKDIKNFIDSFLAELENKKIELEKKSISIFSEKELQTIIDTSSSEDSTSS